MSFELERTETERIQEALEGTFVVFSESLQRPVDELKQSLALYADNSSTEPLTVDNYYAPVALAALRTWLRAQLPPLRGRDIPAEYQSLVNTTMTTIDKLTAATQAQQARQRPVRTFLEVALPEE